MPDVLNYCSMQGCWTIVKKDGCVCTYCLAEKILEYVEYPIKN